MLLIWKLSKSRNIRYSKILGRLSMTRTKIPMHQRDTKRSEYTLSLMSSIVKNSKQGLKQMDISPRNLWEQSTQGLSLSETLDLQCSLQNSMTWNYGEQMLEMHISKHSHERNFTLWVDLRLKHYKDMFLSCTKHSMVQGREEHAEMINSLTYFMTWVSNLQKQTQTYG